MDYTSRQLRAFHLVARLGNFARAAEALFITPSGLSVQIRELEKQLGFRLFDRTTRHVALTADGAALLEVSQRSLRELDEALARLRERAKGASHHHDRDHSAGGGEHPGAGHPGVPGTPA
jgi:DNA-binding transcriptional LysR family regulator